MRKFPARISDDPEQAQAFFFPCYVLAHDHFKGALVNFYLDTGSSDVIMGENDLNKMGVPLASLPHTPKPIAGWGGTTAAFLMRNVCLYLTDSDGKTEAFETPEVVCGRNPRRDKTKTKGILRVTEARRIPIPSVIGRSFLRDTGLIAHVDVKSGDIYLFFPD
ncbi:MAG TPA: hypothetical protein VGB78_07565 [Thermoplasmata archaeon]